MKRSGLIRSSFQKIRRSKPIPRRGRISLSWEEFRNATFETEKDDEGLIGCEDTKLGLQACGVKSSVMDLHHTKGREGKLLFDRSKMVWLTRNCHALAHAKGSK